MKFNVLQQFEIYFLPFISETKQEAFSPSTIARLIANCAIHEGVEEFM